MLNLWIASEMLPINELEATTGVCVIQDKAPHEDVDCFRLPKVPCIALGSVI